MRVKINKDSKASKVLDSLELIKGLGGVYPFSWSQILFWSSCQGLLLLNSTFLELGKNSKYFFHNSKSCEGILFSLAP